LDTPDHLDHIVENQNEISQLLLEPVPIIGMSACSDMEIINRALDAGMTSFIPKPFTILQFNALLEKLPHQIMDDNENL
jgi:CheY-like chemotaxis protein